MPTTPHLDQLKQIHELNRAFLGLLQTRARAQRDCLGLPAAVLPAMRVASQSVLDALAEFPRALFDLEIAGPSRFGAERGHSVGVDEGEHDLCLSILLAARQASRQSAYQARLLFGLATPALKRLSTLRLAEVQRLAGHSGFLRCAFFERLWFWQGLLAATRPESRRQLTLMALQPGAVLEWPQRRPPQPSA